MRTLANSNRPETLVAVTFALFTASLVNLLIYCLMS
jgi:hypothetical protein